MPVAVGDCREDDNAFAGETIYFEEFGAGARCFTVDRSNTKQVGCLRHQCVEGKLYLNLACMMVPNVP
jgi:hypothetical protein